MPQSLKLQLFVTTVITALYVGLLYQGVRAKEASTLALEGTMFIVFWVSLILLRKKTLTGSGVIAMILAPAALLSCSHFSPQTLEPLACFLFTFGIFWGIVATRFEEEPRWVVLTSSLQLIALILILEVAPNVAYQTISAS